MTQVNLNTPGPSGETPGEGILAMALVIGFILFLVLLFFFFFVGFNPIQIVPVVVPSPSPVV
jgi:hypothetical protein